MNSDLVILQNISETLQTHPHASQRMLAEKAGMSIGLMNAVLKRFAQRGWIMLSNVNMRKLSYAVTPEGMTEVAKRSRSFARRTFKLASDYNQILCSLVAGAKKEGKERVLLYGESYIKFLLAYACEKERIEFAERKPSDPPDRNSFCLIGENVPEEEAARLKKEGAFCLLDLLDY
ncbi:MAG: winged helix-turn-helix transcriptional regulator [Treponema sp.]|nr:winged helix-turn-helix transcriptional regulator [Treponema sp.]